VGGSRERKSSGRAEHFLVKRIVQAFLAKEFFLQLFTCYSFPVQAPSLAQMRKKVLPQLLVEF
jgi:hypothetical protein